MNDAERILQVLHSNAISYRNNLFANLAKNQANLVKVGRQLDSHSAEAEGAQTKFKGAPLIDQMHLTMKAIEKIASQITEVDTQLANLQNLTGGSLNYFGSAAPTKETKSATVTTLPVPKPTTQTTGSKAQTGPVNPRTNPGVERQRKRKESSDNK